MVKKERKGEGWGKEKQEKREGGGEGDRDG